MSGANSKQLYFSVSVGIKTSVIGSGLVVAHIVSEYICIKLSHFLLSPVVSKAGGIRLPC